MKCQWNKEWSNANIKIVDCTVCKFKHQYPFPKAEEIISLYEEGYYEKMKPNYLKDVQSEENNRRDWADYKINFFNSTLGTGHKTLLDIGCSFGYFLNRCSKEGFNTLGIEPSRYAAKFAREELGLNVLNSGYQSLDLDQYQNTFDIIHIQEALDHLLNPLHFFSICHNHLLKPGGLLCIETANQFNKMQMAAVKELQIPMWWIVPDHISYFDRPSLLEVASSYGFSLIEECSTFPMELFLLQGENYVLDPQVGKVCHQKRLYFEDKLDSNNLTDLKIEFYRMLTKHGFGRGMIHFYQKGIE